LVETSVAPKSRFLKRNRSSNNDTDVPVEGDDKAPEEGPEEPAPAEPDSDEDKKKEDEVVPEPPPEPIPEAPPAEEKSTVPELIKSHSKWWKRLAMLAALAAIAYGGVRYYNSRRYGYEEIPTQLNV
jgi:hypothetical protein